MHDFKLDKKGEYVLIDIYITERYAHLVGNNSRFWNASGIQLNLDTSGVDIQTGTIATMLNGGIEFITPDLNHKKIKHHSVYRLYSSHSDAEESGVGHYKQDNDNKIIQITCTQLGSLTIGSKLYYKKIPVGEIVDYRLNTKNDTIIISAAIKDKYQHLVKSNSRFWRNSGLKIKAGLSGVDVKMAPVHSLLNGGISFANIVPSAEQAKHGSVLYNLYVDQQQALMKVVQIQIKFALAKGVTAGTAINYLGIQVGEVTRVELSENNQAIIAHAKLWNSATEFARQGSQFWLVSAKVGLFKSEHLDTLIKGNYLQIEPGQGQKTNTFCR